LRLGEIVVKRITVIEFAVDDEEQCTCRGCFGIKVRMDAVKLANIIAVNFKESLVLIRKC